MNDFEDDIFESFFHKQENESKEVVNDLITFINKQLKGKTIDRINNQLISETIVEYLNIKDIGIRPTELRQVFTYCRENYPI